MTNPCPCGSGTSYEQCCGPFHIGTAAAPTAERLMRSRYTAFVLHNAPYLLETWHPSSRPTSVKFDPALRWTGLEILGRHRGGLFDEEGTVEFRAAYRRGNAPGLQHENSNFRREQGRWHYVDGNDL